MPLPHRDTTVDYPAGETTGTATVVYSAAAADHTLVVTDSTVFHPVDHGWPDQGPDRGTISLGGTDHDVVDVVLGATDGSDLWIGADIPVRKGTDGWAFVVVHLLAGSLTVPEGAAVGMTVDSGHRAALSAGHTACHLAALALNAALADRWRKDVAADSLGHPDFDGMANTRSTILPDGAVDLYRLGKSLRRKGFDADGLSGALPRLADAVDATLAGWIATGAAVRVRAEGPLLTDRRYWACELPDGEARMPCGGTHVDSLAAYRRIGVRWEFDEPAGTLTMTTTAQR